MDSFTLLLLVIFIVIAFVLLNRIGDQTRLLQSLSEKIKDLNNRINDLSVNIKAEKKETAQPTFQKEKIIPIVKPIPVIIKPIVEEKEPEIIPQKIVAASVITEAPPVIPAITTAPVAKKKSTNDIEKFIGENLANKIGIAVLVLGIGFFIKYAIDNEWINETFRVVIGLVCGAILIGLAHYYRNNYRSFSSVLVGGGISVFYFSIAFAFHQYGLISQTTAFVCMVIVSVFAVLLSIYYGRQELAIIGIVGGFITPFLVSNGQNNYVALFTYLCILNAGVMALAWFKRWPAINSIALISTTIIYGGWLIKTILTVDDAIFPVTNAFLFATLFYLLFVAMNIVNCVRLKNKFASFDFIILLSSNFLYFAAGIIIVGHGNAHYSEALFAFSLGLFNLLLTGIFYRHKETDRNFVLLLIGLAATFISLSIPIQFNGSITALCWIAEAIILLLLHQRTSMPLLRKLSVILSVLSIISLVITWFELYLFNYDTILVIFNKGFITGLLLAVGLFFYHRLLSQNIVNGIVQKTATPSFNRFIQVAAIVILYLTGLNEIYFQFNQHYSQAPIHVIYTLAYTFAFAIILLQVYKKSTNNWIFTIAVPYFCFALFLIQSGQLYEASIYLVKAENGGLFAVQWLGAILLLWMLISLAKFLLQQSATKKEDINNPLLWITITGIIITLSIELYHLILWGNYRNQADWPWWENLYYKAVLSIAWSICSFVLMWLGMKYNQRILRIISLSLFTITLAKLFLYDIRNMPPGGKIAAFILLGVLLLVVSFMYQRLKKMIIDNAANTEKNETQ